MVPSKREARSLCLTARSQPVEHPQTLRLGEKGALMLWACKNARTY